MKTEVLERRKRVLELISLKRHTTVTELANELNVSQRTVQRDIERLSCEYPLVTTMGRNGGVSFIDGYYYSGAGFYITEKQKTALEKLATLAGLVLEIGLSAEDLETVKSLIEQHKRRK